MTVCRCPIPDPNPPDPLNRVLPDFCKRCQKRISKEWTSNDKTTKAFFDRVADALPGWPDLPADWETFRMMAEAREFAGRDTFGHRSLNRDNCLDAAEEAGDFAVYMHLHVLRGYREGRGDEDIALALTAAWHAYKAWSYAMAARHGG